MKRLLPILTLALFGAVSIVSAGNTYTEADFLADTNYKKNFDKLVKVENGVYDQGSYQVVVNGVSRFTIHAKKDISLYVYDFVDNVQSGDNSGNALNGANQAQNKLPVQLIGYRTKGEADEYVVNSDTGEALLKNGEKITGYTGEVHSLGTPTDTEIISRVGGDGAYQIVRNSYYLGEFKADTDYELFVSYAADGSDGLWSFENYAGQYLTNKDKLMAAYIAGSFDPIPQSIYPLTDEYTALAKVNNTSFGLRAVGSPLPGGLQIALIAGLFGLGFWYIRRRKATVA